MKYQTEQFYDEIFDSNNQPRPHAASLINKFSTLPQRRVEALNLFIDDIYHKQLILKEKIVPEEILYSSKGFLKQCIGINPPKGIWNHISGIDLIRDKDGSY